jgi:hypothetical protein
MSRFDVVVTPGALADRRTAQEVLARALARRGEQGPLHFHEDRAWSPETPASRCAGGAEPGGSRRPRATRLLETTAAASAAMRRTLEPVAAGHR